MIMWLIIKSSNIHVGGTMLFFKSAQTELASFVEFVSWQSHWLCIFHPNPYYHIQYLFWHQKENVQQNMWRSNNCDFWWSQHFSSHLPLLIPLCARGGFGGHAHDCFHLALLQPTPTYPLVIWESVCSHTCTHARLAFSHNRGYYMNLFSFPAHSPSPKL